MTDKKTPLTIVGIKENIYGGFWTRLGSLLLDLIILLPYIFILQYINGLNKNAYYYTFIPGLIVQFWFNIYLVKKYGGTPGKLIVGIKILKLDGTDVTWREAVLRQSIAFVLTIFASCMTIYALSLADGAYFERLSWIQKQQYLLSLTPLLVKIYTWTNNCWVYSEFFVLLFNKRKRALHDFIADTVIIKTKYIEQVREAMAAEQSTMDPIHESNQQ
jgi:uncharacterized RDD family membrane protein YckC